jgi:3-oxoacyl-[acyl-carrier protein] reductase
LKFILEGGVAVVTGATGGIGEAVCRALADAGASVAIGFNTSPNAATKLADTLPGHGHHAVALPVTDSKALASAARSIERSMGSVDVLVNCAGITRFVAHSDLSGLEDALIDDIFATNVRGVIATIRAFEPLLRRSENAVIVNISSIAGTTAMGSNIAYCASKAAVDNLTRSLARALAPSIRVVSVAPGLVDTPFVRDLDSSWREQQIRSTPLGRLASPEEVAGAVLAAVTALRFTTGAVLPVDGGRPLV